MSIMRFIFLCVLLHFASGRQDSFREEDSSAEILGALEGAFGADFRADAEQWTEEAVGDLAGMFAALPKNDLGRVAAPTAKYAIYRVLSKRRGWVMDGIAPNGKPWNASLPTDAFKGIAPSSVQRLFEHRLVERGFGLRELALMLATLESIATKDAMDRINQAYRAMGLKLGEPALAAQADQALETFMRSLLLGPKNATRMTPKITEKLSAINMSTIYPGWPSTVEFLDRVKSTWMSDASQENKTGFALMKKAARQVAADYGVWQDQECRVLKADLIKLQDPNCPGYVQLGDFYGSAFFFEKWWLTEKLQYLDDTGNIDRSDPENPKLIIANYVTSPANCVTSTTVASTCCLNECDALLSRLEAKIAAPTASPSLIAAVVADFETPFQAKRAELPADVLQHLLDIAAAGAGQVPLHGLRFENWLHHAFPYDCPRPFRSTSSVPWSPLEWSEATGMNPDMSASEIRSWAVKGSVHSAMVRRLSGGLSGNEGASPSKASCPDRTIKEEELLSPSSPQTLSQSIGVNVSAQICLLAVTLSFLLGSLKVCRIGSSKITVDVARDVA